MVKKTILFVSQDRGSGNTLYPLIKKLFKDDSLKIRVLAAKQSKEIFQEQGILFSDSDNRYFNQELNVNPDLIITGASMRQCVEKEAVLYGRHNQIKTITILDFWSHYWERFTTSGKKDMACLPDYIFVMDHLARDQMISEGFPDKRLIITGNPYFDTFGFPDGKEENFNIDSILFISQPVYHNGSYQLDSGLFEDFLDIVSRLDQKINIIVRPHPKDHEYAYKKYAVHHIIVKDKTDIQELIRDSDIVVGKNSTVLFEAVFWGKLVVSYQPVKENTDRLVTNQLGLSHLVQTKTDLEIILRKAIDRKIKRKKLGKIKYYNDGKCTERVIRHVKMILRDQ